MVLVNHPFRPLLGHSKRKKLRGDKSSECSGCAKAIKLCLAEYVLTTNVQCTSALLNRNKMAVFLFSYFQDDLFLLYL
jgi:hypothetical protein